MPILTKEQIWEAIEELPAHERAESEQFLPPLELSEEQKQAALAELAAFDQNPTRGVSWEEFERKVRSRRTA